MSQNKYNIRFNPPELSSEQISKHQNFDDLLAQFEASAPEPVEQSTGRVVRMRNWRRTIRYAASVGAAAMVALVLYFNLNNNPSIEMEVAKKMANMPYVNPPIEEMQKEFATFKVDGTTGGVYEYESGSKVTVPANAFVDENGGLVTGEVELRYREFHDFVDFFLGGIPMDYDSANVKHQLISAGMIEVLAFKNGEPVQISEDKQLDVELISTIDYHPDYKFNIYKLDVENRNWNYEGIDNIEPIFTGELKAEMDAYLNGDTTESVEAIALANINNQIAAIEGELGQELAELESTVEKPAEPTTPQQSMPDDIVTEFEFDDLAMVDPEIAAFVEQYGNVVWVAPKSEEENLKIATSDIEWNDVRLEKIPNSNFFKVVLTSSAEAELNLRLRPVLTGNNFQKALQDYEAALDKFNEQMAARTAQLQARKEEIAKRHEERLASLKADKMSYEEKLATFKQKGYKSLVTETIANQKIVNKFKVTSMGIWNCDRPIPPALQTFKAKFQDKTAQPMDYMKGYLVNKNQNTVVHFLTTGDKAVKFQYYNDAENIMWAVGGDGKLYVVYPEDFDKIEEDINNYTFNFDKIGQPIESEADLREVLKF